MSSVPPRLQTSSIPQAYSTVFNVLDKASTSIRLGRKALRRVHHNAEELMKIPSRVDGSVCGALLSNRLPSSLRPSATTAGRRSRRTARDVGHVEASTNKPWASFFCPRSSLWLLSTFMPVADRRQLVRPRRPQDAPKTYSTAAGAATKPPASVNSPAKKQDKGDLRSFLHGQLEGSVEAHLDFHRDPYLRRYAPANTPQIQVSENKHDVEYPSRDSMLQASDGVQQTINRLYAAIAQRQRLPSRHPLEPIHKLYAELPEPRMLYLSWQWRNRLLRVMGTPRKRDVESMLRYFSLVADVKNAGITLRRSQWNFALAFATKYVARATSQEMESALRLWREMEREARIRGNDVTFNVLFDVASKAGNFTLADMVYQEMEHRGIEFNRYHHVSLIHYFGLRLDSGGIRAAYREMVDAGEMIDTVVLNCVISGLLRCGEESEAEETYQRMRSSHALASEIPPRDYMMNKVVTKVLMMFSKVGKNHPQLKQSLQTHAQLTPDLHTYKLVIEHFAVRVGNLKKVAQYLDDMKHLKIPLHPTIFLALFKGFAMHGGFDGSDWSEQRLEGVLAALYNARDENARIFRVDRWLVIWALRAVQKCSSREAVTKTYDMMARRWDVPADRQPFMHAIFENIVGGKDMKSPGGSWEGPSYRRQKKDGSRT